MILASLISRATAYVAPKVLLALVCLFLGAAAGWWARGGLEQWQRNKELQEAAEAKAKDEDTAARISDQLEKELARIRSRTETIYRRLPGEFQKNDYGCTVPADGVRAVNAALSDN